MSKLKPLENRSGTFHFDLITKNLSNTQLIYNRWKNYLIRLLWSWKITFEKNLRVFKRTIIHFIQDKKNIISLIVHCRVEHQPINLCHVWPDCSDWILKLHVYLNEITVIFKYKVVTGVDPGTPTNSYPGSPKTGIFELFHFYKEFL